MSKIKKYFYIVVLPMLLCIGLELLTDIPDLWGIALYLLLNGWLSYLLDKDRESKRTVNLKKNLWIGVPALILSIAGLIVLNNRAVFLNGFWLMMAEVAMSLAFSISVVFLIGTFILWKQRIR